MKALSLLSISTLAVAGLTTVAAATAGTADAAVPTAPSPNPPAPVAHSASIPAAQPVDALSTYNQDYSNLQTQEGQAALPALAIGTGIGCVVGGVLGLPTGVGEIVTLPLGCLTGFALGAGVASIATGAVAAANANRLNSECLAARLPAFDCPWPQQYTTP
ncbi:hypothetical protein [Nocardia alni]|uniref:hypothetical protein n=1 Tax=Nocardia alni TaxID=2815723 RepID=UPI001C24367F|nr:hypothetical protein [Nocardia alni]